MGSESGPNTDDLDLEAVSDLEEFGQLMHILQARADISLRGFETATRKDPVRLHRSTLSDATNGRRLLQRRSMEAFLAVCGVQGPDATRWMRAWERLAPAHARGARTGAGEEEPDAEAVLEEARAEAAALVAEGRRQAEHEADQILAQARQEAQHIREQADRALDSAGALTATMFSLGALLEKSRHVPQAEAWYQRSAKVGRTLAATSLGLLMDQTDGGDQAGLFLLQEASWAAEAEVWLHQAAEAGNTDAMVALGLLLHRAYDVRGAGVWLRQAAEAGNTDAMVALGLLMEDGRGERAEVWLRQAAETRDITAMSSLGSLLHKAGRVQEAEHWRSSAAEAAKVGAAVGLGSLLLTALRMSEESDRGEDETAGVRHDQTLTPDENAENGDTSDLSTS